MLANQRQRKILEILYTRKYTTRAVLANLCEVSKRTIDNDIVLLTLEYPIYTLQGHNDGIYMAKGYAEERKAKVHQYGDKEGNRCQSMQRACVLGIYCVRATMQGCTVTSKICKPLTTRHMQQSFQEKRVQN